jgi:AcrR family transcriptional regulator
MEVTYTPMEPEAEPTTVRDDDTVQTDDPEALLPSRGRPRAVGRTAEILKATIELFEEVGYDHLRIQDIADRAGAGLATIYRRWPNKQALVADAIRHKARELDTPPSGDPRADLHEQYRSLAEHACGKRAEFLPGMLAAVRAEPEISSAFCEQLIDRFHCRAKEQLEQLLGTDHPHLDLLADIAPALVMYRSLVPGSEPLDADRFADEVLDVVLGCANAGRGDAATPAVKPRRKPTRGS